MAHPFPSTRVKWWTVLFALIPPVTSFAQFDVGASAGAQFVDMHAAKGEGHDVAYFKADDGLSPCAAVFYREASGRTTDLTFELQYSRKQFQANYGGGGLGSNSSTNAHVDLHLLHVLVAPQFYLRPAHRATFRCGLEFGVLLQGTMTGTASTFSITTGSKQVPLENHPASDFHGDLRVLLGVGLIRPLSASHGLTIDPYASLALGSLYRGIPKARGVDLGLRIGYCWRSKGRNFTQLFSPDAGAVGN